MIRRIHLIALALVTVWIGFASAPAVAQSGRTFYIDYSSGSNSNPGTKTSPWKSHPYMQTGTGCTGSGSAPAYSHAAGDQFIFKGGVTWPAACFVMTIQAGGTPSAQDYYGVDPSWYSGGSWTRPQFDLNYSVPTSGIVIEGGSHDSGYTTFDNLEIAHQGIQLGGYANSEAYQFASYPSSATGTIIENNYIHDWATSQTLAFGSTDYSNGSILGFITLDSTEISDAGGYGYYGGNKVNVGFGGACENCREVKKSSIHNTMAACFTVSLCHDNELYNITAAIQTYDANIHSQVVESDGDEAGDVIYNNVIHDNNPVGVTIYECDTAQIFNNVLWNNANKQIMVGGQCSGSGPSAVLNVYNNTVDCSNGTPCFGTDSKGTLAGTLNLKNNQWITNGGAVSNASAITQFNQSNNITMTGSTASSQGYTSANAYEPTSSTGGTVNAALSLSNLCTGALASLCTDRLGNQRLTSWDAGAYEFGGAQSSSKPNPPTNLTASVQ